MIRRRIAMAVIGLSLLAVPVMAETIMVGPTGAYTALDRVPWQKLRPGDQIILQAGSVLSGNVRIEARGSESAPIRIKAAAGTRPILRGSISVVRSAHVVIEEFTIEDARDAGVLIVEGSQAITVRDMTIRRNSMGVWIALNARGSHRIVDNELSANATHGIGVDKVANSPGDESIFAGNRVFDNGHFGISIIGSRFIVEGNRVHDNGRTQWGTSGIHIYAGGFRDAPRLEGMGSHNIIRYNTVFRTRDDKTYDGNGIQADLWADDNEIAYNIVFDNDGSGIIVFGAARNRIVNNTVIGNYRDPGKSHLFWGEISVATGDPPRPGAVAKGNIVKNNIVVSTNQAHAIFVDASAARAGNEFGGNLLFRWGPGRLFSWGGEGGGDIARWNRLAKSFPADAAGDPAFIDFERRPEGLGLQPTSPAVRRGHVMGYTRDHAGAPLALGQPPSIGALEPAR